MSKRKRIRRILAAIGVVILLLIVAALQSVNWYQPRVTQAQVRQWIKSGLPMRSTIPQTVAFLHLHGVSPGNISSAIPNRTSGSSDGFEQKDPSGQTLYASLPDAYPGFIVSGGIYMKFGFNAKGRLTRYQLRDIYTGL